MKRHKTLACLAVLLAALCSVAAVRVDSLQSHVEWLSHPERAGRRAGSPGAVQAAEYIAAQFRQAGFEVQMQEFGGNRRNVVARYGSSERYIVAGAHYDGQGPGFPSASDNAAGVALLLELGRELAAADLPVSLVLIAFDDEEQGLNGSRFYVENSPFPLDEAMAVVIFDAMGRNFLDLQTPTLFTLGTEYSPELAAIVGQRRRDGMLVAGTDLIGARSDYAAFAVARIPFLFFSHATHKDYHGPGDAPDRIDYARLAADGELIGQVLRDIAALEAKPAYLASPVYPPSETEALRRVLALVRAERPDLPAVYHRVFEDMEARVQTAGERGVLQVAAAALLAAATPEFSPFVLNFMLVPFYQQQGQAEIVAALMEESARWLP